LFFIFKQDKVVGFHYLGPNAGEVTQGFAIGLRLGATKDDFDTLIGIHPTNAEVNSHFNHYVPSALLLLTCWFETGSVI